MKIIVDAFGGDNAPKEIIEGAVNAVKEKEFTLVLVGEEEKIKKELEGKGYPADRVEILSASEVIGMGEEPVESIRKKKDSSIVVGLRALNDWEDAGAFVSAGSTGAVLTGAVFLTRRIRGIRRPALAPVLPSLKGGNVLLVDCGANAECKPADLVQFAKMGAAYCEEVAHIENPKIGLLSNGTEDAKGSPLNKEAFPLLKESGLNFVGNMEGRDLLSGDYDVVVSDGFSGNIALKTAEGVAMGMFGLMKDGIMASGLRAKIGYLLLKPVLKVVKKKLDYNDQGGAVLLGLKKIVVKAHGSSKAKSVKAAVLQALSLATSGMVENLERKLETDETV